MDEFLKQLEEFPRFLTGALDQLGDPGARARPDPESWSLCEELWHLADLEREGYLVRIERLLAEDAPRLEDFDGDAVAAARDYNAKDPYLGLQRFRAARSTALARLRALDEGQRHRSGVQEGHGALVLGDLSRLMCEHDAQHRRSIEALLARPRAAR
ncbi:MAG: DinB family protein [Planctomycetes bacterium]|nr:DinB family protein [Planctomycetota bacterium]